MFERFRFARLLTLGGALAGAACAEDRILPVELADGGTSLCGNAQVDPGEGCDNDSPGCALCQVVSGWTCLGDKCDTVCGDSIIVAPEVCDPPNGTTCDSSCQSGSKAEACDMTGYWIGRQTDFSIDRVVKQVQTSSNWFFFKITQTGDDYRVDQSLNCGIQVSGTVDVNLHEDGLRYLQYANPADGRVDPNDKTSTPRPARSGQFKSNGAGCDFSMSRIYYVRGGDPALLPADFSTAPDLSTLPPLPDEADPLHPTGPDTGAIDVDGDLHPGLAWFISAGSTGIRNTIQRDWSYYGMRPEYPIGQNAIEFVAGEFFANQENILFIEQCPALGCKLPAAKSDPSQTLPHRVTFRFLGKALTEPRVAAVAAKPPLVDSDDDLAICAAVRAALPHDRSNH